MFTSDLNRKIAPVGYIDLRSAIQSVRRRMFTTEIPPEVLDAAKANVDAARRMKANDTIVFEKREISKRPNPIELIANALQCDALRLFIYTESGQVIGSIPSICAHEVLEKVGFLGLTQEMVAVRFRDFYPRRILNAPSVPGLDNAQFENFALCLRENLFDDWLAGTARQLRWPLDLKSRGRGRPKLVPIVKSILKDVIDSGRWRQGMPLKGLVSPIQSKLKGEKVNRETVKKAMHELYRETGQVEYRYVRRKRRRFTKADSDGRRILR